MERTMNLDSDERVEVRTDEHYRVGHRRPPLHSRFKPGQSGNPSGRVKGSKNLKTLFHQILNEEITLREGAETKKMTKAEAMMRGLIINALKGDSRSMSTMFRLAELSGQFDDAGVTKPITQIILTGVRAGEVLEDRVSPEYGRLSS
jgi:hypothetical protein